MPAINTGDPITSSSFPMYGFVNVATGTNGIIDIPFPAAFIQVPQVFASVRSNSDVVQYTAQVRAVTGTSVSVRIMGDGTNVGSGLTVTVDWVAFGTRA